MPSSKQANDTQLLSGNIAICHRDQSKLDVLLPTLSHARDEIQVQISSTSHVSPQKLCYPPNPMSLSEVLDHLCMPLLASTLDTDPLKTLPSYP